jgi:hypothetical protein
MIAAPWIALALFVAQPPPLTQALVAPCPPTGMTRADLLELKQSKFTVASPEARNVLALRLLGCLDSPDPQIRDGVVFEGLSTWLRGRALLPATILSLEASLRKTLGGEKDEGGFRLPFAALVLAEVARADRIEPVFSDSVREALVDLAAASLIRVDDYRGFDNLSGWRHGVAHGSDLVLQLALNPRFGASGLRRMTDAIGAQVAPRGAVFYTFGEPERLARAVLFTYRRGLLDAAFWEGWFSGLKDPSPLANWGAAFQSVEGLARRHNTIAFLHALAFGARAAGDPAGAALATMADKAAAQIIEG